MIESERRRLDRAHSPGDRMTVGFSDVAEFLESMMPVLVPAGIWGAWFIASRRFERRRRRQGTWDEHGPKDPTYSPNRDLRALGIDQPTIEGHQAPPLPPRPSGRRGGPDDES
jgi:hypothetical protein